jgi:hypothetical protein
MGAERTSNGKGQTRHANLNKQLHNTKMCVYYKQGSCKYGAKCVFAHSEQDVAQLPDLAKTRICVNFEAGNCQDPNCLFAHSYEELRSTDFYFKTTLCTWHAAGKCRNGAACRFAHGATEMRNAGAPNAPNTGSQTKKAASAPTESFAKVANNGTKKQTPDQPSKQAGKIGTKEQPAKPSSKKSGQSGAIEKDAKDSKKRSKPKATTSSVPHLGLGGTEDQVRHQPMFIQPDPTLLQHSVPSFLSSPATLADYQHLPGYGLIPGMGLNLPQHQTSFSPYASTYPAASEASFSPYASTYAAATPMPGAGNEQDHEIAALSASIKSLSGQIRQLQKHIVPASTNEVKAGQSDSTKSGSSKSGSYSQSQSSGDSSPPSTPPMQHGAFSRSDVERLKWQLHLAAMAQGVFLGHNPNAGYVQGM